MDLWTEFEGVTIDSAFALTKLVQTEGRSAFFSTRNANGESVLIRIIECHFDEDEILARWRGVQTLGNPNFLRIDRFGQFYIEADDSTAVYVVFEHVDANLGEVLARGRLCAADATHIGLSVSSAVETLHANGFVHEHIETRNIYAVGDKVKLRSDCIRETPEGEAGIEARRRDVYELTDVLMQVLLGTPRGSSAPRQPLPAPFDEIVRNGMNGSWGLTEIKAALGRIDLPKAAPQRTTRSEPALSKPAPSATQAASMAASASTSDVSAKPLSPDQPAKSKPQPERSASSASNAAKHADLSRQKSPMELPVIFGISEHDFRIWTTAGVLLIGVVLIGWMFLHHWFGHRAGTAEQPVSRQPVVAGPDPAAMPPTASSSLAAPALGAQPMVEWRVVAFTYNRQDQAQKKALSLVHQHPSLWPVIFSPTGKAPWLVTIGGVLQRDAAYALARKARSLGLPSDTYAQDYTVR